MDKSNGKDSLSINIQKCFDKRHKNNRKASDESRSSDKKTHSFDKKKAKADNVKKAENKAKRLESNGEPASNARIQFNVTSNAVSSSDIRIAPQPTALTVNSIAGQTTTVNPISIMTPVERNRYSTF